MAMRSLASRSLPLRRSAMEGLRSSSRFFSDGKGGILSEEERAAENVYIQKPEDTHKG
ncbi:hypothetical protein QJS04_geneDACA008518 [Acorus gramineus]|uniref:Uncharacterized protein n=1 Tax=Acorus gramineus TaxID=55184 RepID=A0AAV9AJI2_ACOGR|nr:hypothetical protein QJS04_geneDACA008518 [Acorus gramineus]